MPGKSSKTPKVRTVGQPSWRSSSADRTRVIAIPDRTTSPSPATGLMKNAGAVRSIVATKVGVLERGTYEPESDCEAGFSLAGFLEFSAKRLTDSLARVIPSAALLDSIKADLRSLLALEPIASSHIMRKKPLQTSITPPRRQSKLGVLLSRPKYEPKASNPPQAAMMPKVIHVNKRLSSGGGALGGEGCGGWGMIEA